MRKKYVAVVQQEYNDIDLNYRVCDRVHVVHDDKYGEHPKANDTCWFTLVRDGKVFGGTDVFKSNKDGFDAKTTIDEYKKADYKILLFGDSYSHWNQNNSTWPDILQNNLNKNPGKKVAILNFARGAYSMIQMLDLAGDKIPELHPDLVIFATVGSSVTTCRWWSKEVTDKEGWKRWLMTTENGEYQKYIDLTDLSQVTDGATKAWCQQQLATPNPNDPVLKKASEQFVIMTKRNIDAKYHVPLVSFNRSYLFSRIFKGYPLEKKEYLPQTAFNDLMMDGRIKADMQKIKAANTPVLLLYMPTMAEIKNKNKVYYDGQTASLLASVEKMMNTRFHFIQKEYTCPLPDTIDLEPIDRHPNYKGLNFYADAVTPLVLAKMDGNP